MDSSNLEKIINAIKKIASITETRPRKIFFRINKYFNDDDNVQVRNKLRDMGEYLL